MRGGHATPRAAAWIAILAILGGLAAPAGGGALGATRTARLSAAPAVTAVESIALVVSDLDRSERFFTSVLQFAKVSDIEIAGGEVERLEGVFGARLRVSRLRLGDERLDLIEYLAPRGRPIPAEARSHDRIFQHVAIIVSDMDAAYERLRENRVEHASSGPQRLPDWNANAGGIRAFYFKDPDGHPLEILQFPPDKGDARWRRPAPGRLFHGIDHTAIVVGDTGASLRFYRDVLGMRVAGTSENYGTEQEHLNGVFGARLRITSLRAASGPGIEFLEYLAPSDGRPAPADSRGNDLWSWQTRLAAGVPAALVDPLRAAGGLLVSPGAVVLPEGSGLDLAVGMVVRDPDGHALLLGAGAGDR